MAFLVLLQQGEVIPHEIVDEETVVGRHPDCGLQLDSNMVSRRHCKIIRDGAGYSIEDHGSGNGTFLNGSRITGKTTLNQGDRIKLGPVLLRFELAPDELPTGGAAGDSGRLFRPLFSLDISNGQDDTSTITDSVDSSTFFGLLDVQPEAKLKGVLEISRGLAGTVDVESMLPKVLETLFEIFPSADRGSILLKDDETGEMVPAVQKHRRPSEDHTVKLSRTILEKVLREKTGILSADASSDERFEASHSISTLTIRSLMCVPMLDLEGEPMGIINIDTQNPVHRFRREDLDLLVAVAGQASLSLENARLVQSHLQRQKYENEMNIAHNVQEALLPEDLPQVAGYEFFASYDAALAVGGDYYDCFLLGEDCVCVSFGDVAGKGVPASLVMSRIASAVQTTMHQVSDVGRAAAAVNRHMCDKAVAGRFVTWVLIVIDVAKNEMTGVVAGHMCPLIRTAEGEIEEFAADSIGIPIGVMEDYPYKAVTRKIARGETVLIYTDGVSEAMNPQGELYGVEAVRRFLKDGPPTAGELGPALREEVRRHADGRPQNDDIAIFVFGRDRA